ncbi:MAG: murein biosynthesis integral membrane protein MurJ [Planctomycetota bacterium]
MSESGRRIVRASLVVMAAHLIFKFSGFLQALVLARVCTPLQLELFTFGFESVLFTIYLVGEEGLGPAFLPVFMEERDKRGEAPAWGFASSLLTLQAVVLAVVVSLAMLLPEDVVALLTDWDERPGRAAEKLAGAPGVVRWMIPGLFGLSIGSTTYLILNGYKRFFLAALGDASVKLAIIAAAALGYAMEEPILPWLAGGVVLGGLAKVVTHLAGLSGEIGRFRPRAAFGSPAFRRFALLVLPLLVGIVFAKARDWYNETWVLSTLPGTLISINKYGKKLFQTIGWLVPYSASIAMYPFFCEMVDRADRRGLARVATTGCHIIAILCVPLTATVVALSLPMVRQIYENPNFDLAMCRQAALANAAFTLVLPFYALEYVFMQTYFSNRRMWTPILLGLLCSSFSMALAYLGGVLFVGETAAFLSGLGLFAPGDTGSAGIVAVGMDYTLSRVLKVVLLAGMMKRFLPELDGRHAASFLGRILLAGALAGAAVYGVRLGYEGMVDTTATHSFGANLQVLGPLMVLAGLAGLGVYVAALRLFCPTEWAQTVHWTGERIRAWRAKREG